MIEIVSKLSEIFKASILPLFLLTAVDSAKSYIKEERKLSSEDKAPGDNFPHIVMSHKD